MARAWEVDPEKLPAPASHTVDFIREVRPILEESCYSCHGPKRQRSDFRLDIKNAALHGGAGFSPNIIPGDSAASPLIHFVAGLAEDEEMLMPSKGDRLTADQIGILRAWIDQGATWPEDEGLLENSEPWRTHWSFQSLVRPEVPDSVGQWGRNPVDAFVHKKLVERNLSPSPEADRRTLIRRLSFDLVGLPPTPAEVEEFLVDRAPDAYERLVDRLLASPHYGERWARHWLDVVSFAESDGFERNNLRMNAWPYRDYLIRSFNEGKPLR